MNLVEHLEELRKRIIVTLATFIIFLVIGFVFAKDIYYWFIRDLDFQLTVLGPGEILWIYLMLATVVAITGTIPILAFQIWLFVRPGLTKKEQRVTIAYIPALFILFLAGLSFGYFVILPIVFDFLLTLGEGMFQTMFTIQKYFQFVMSLTLPFSFLFEIPVVTMFLTSIGIINPYQLQKMRKYAYFVLVVIAVIISPPDFFSDVIIVVPLLILYEFSIILSKIVYRRKLKRELIEANMD